MNEICTCLLTVPNGGLMDFKFFRNRIKVSLYSIGIFAFFLLVSLVSLYIVREKILDNSHIMGQQLAARLATRETGRIKAQEMLLRSAAQNLAHMLEMKPDMTDAELEEALTHFTDYMEKMLMLAALICAL